MEKEKKLAAVDEAIRRIERGWTQSAYCRDAGGKALTSTDPDGEAFSYCLIGSFTTQSLLQEEVVKNFLDPASGILTERLGRPAYAIHWNDQQGRTKEEVLGLLRELRERINGE